MQFNLVWSDGVTHLECRHQRVYNLGINPMPPMPLLLMLQLLHYLAAFLYLWFCQDWWGNCPAALTGLEINDFIEERQQKMYSGKINFPECKLKVSMKRGTRRQVWHAAEKLHHLEYDSQTSTLMKTLLAFTQKWLEVAGSERWKHSGASRSSVI